MRRGRREIEVRWRILITLLDLATHSHHVSVDFDCIICLFVVIAYSGCQIVDISIARIIVAYLLKRLWLADESFTCVLTVSAIASFCAPR